MELLYIWVSKYECFTNAGFNFNPKHRFEFDSKTSTLEYYQNKNIVEDYFNNEKNKNNRKGKIININTVVGNNGSGKTTLLEIIFKNLVNGVGGIRLESIYIFDSKEDNNHSKIKFYYNYNKGDQITENIFLKADNQYSNLFTLIDKNIIKNEFNDQISNKHFPEVDMRDTHFIYLSNTFDKKYYNYNKVGNISDLSTIGLIMDAKLGLEFASQQEKENLFDLNLSYFYSEFNRQIKFVTEYQDHYKKYIPFILPKKVIVNFIDFERKKSEICKRIDDNEINNKLEAIFNYYNNNFSHETIFKIEIAKRLLIMLLNYYINKSKENPRIYSEIKLAIKSIKLKNEI